MKLITVKTIVNLFLFLLLVQQPGDQLVLEEKDFTVYSGFYVFGAFHGYCVTCLNYDYKNAVFMAGYSIRKNNGQYIYVYTYGGGYKLEDGIPVYTKPFWLPIQVIDIFHLDTCMDYTILGGSVTLADGTKIPLVYEGKKAGMRYCIYNEYLPMIVK